MSSGGHYVRLPYAWKAIVEVGSPAPAEYLASLMTQALRYGIPTARRFGRIKGAIARRGLPRGPLVRALRFGPRRRQPELDAFRDRLEDEWSDLGTDTPCPRIEGMLVLERAAARTIFLFAGGSYPALVCKVPRGSEATVEREAAALVGAAQSGVAPRFLGTAAGSWVQEGIAGEPLKVEPLDREVMRFFPWPRRLEVLCDGLTRLAQASAKPTHPHAAERSLFERAASCRRLTPATRDRITMALADLERIGIGVLKHSDTSPQNCLFVDGRLSGIVDWEMAEAGGMPASDVLNAAVSFLEHGIGLSSWSEDEIVECFRFGWEGSPFFTGARAAARAAAVAAGVDEDAVPSLEVAFFARRLARRLEAPDRYPTGVHTSIQILESVCGS